MPIEDENLPIEIYNTSRKTYYPGLKFQNKFYTTGTRVYHCIKMTEHLPRHFYQFGRYLHICYDSQPNFITIKNDNNNSQDTLPLEKQPTPQQQLQEDTHSQQTSEDEHQTSEDRAYSRNLVQHSILARKGTFL